jgi:hypothetical protein
MGTHGSICFNCRHRWELAQGYSFSIQEFARLAVYRAAVKAGFYTDEL